MFAMRQLNRGCVPAGIRALCAKTNHKRRPRRGLGICGLLVVGAPIGGRKVDLPETWRGGIKFKRDMETFRRFPGWARDLAADALLCAAMLDHEVRFSRKALFHHHHRAVRGYAQRGCVDGCRNIL